MIPFFDSAEVERRRRVWVALSDLYLDTDSRLNYVYIARVLADSNFSIEELHAILLEEIAPVLEQNLLQVAGVWDGFDEHWLVEQVLRRQGRKRRVWLLLNIEDDWRVVAALTRILRGIENPEARAIRCRAWQALNLLFVSKNYWHSPYAAPVELPIQELETIFRNELWPLLAQSPSAQHPDGRELEANWRTFAATLPVQD